MQLKGSKIIFYNAIIEITMIVIGESFASILLIDPLLTLRGTNKFIMVLLIPSNLSMLRSVSEKR